MSTATMPPSAIALSASMAVAAGLLGCFALMRRMTLAADALSHVALPGIGLALLLHVHPLAGALAALGAGVLLIWVLEQRTHVGIETVIGVVFSAALAVGALLTTGEALMDALFGAPGRLSTWESAAGLVGAAVVIGFVLVARDRLIVTLVSPDLALTSGINVKRLNLLYLLAFALTVALGLRFLGVLLMGSLVIIPAATARRLARDLTNMLTISVLVALVSTLLGASLAARLQRESGPLIIAVAAACFLAAAVRPARA
jgi:ABC-type Mn2+/Zn2+ transport system permease subunit